METNTLRFALRLWSKSQQFNQNSLKYLKAALSQAIPTLNSDQSQDFNKICDQIELHELKQLLNSFESQIQKTSLRSGTIRNYRSALQRFIAWAEEQPWWFESQEKDPPKNAPKKVGLGFTPMKAVAKLKGNDYFYKFPEEQLPESLAFQLRCFEVFRLSAGEEELIKNEQGKETSRRKRQKNPLYNRKLDKISKTTFETEKYAILQYLGWLVNIQEEDIHQLDLKSILLDTEMIRDHVFWLIKERQCTHARPLHIVRAAISYAKLVTFDLTERRDWSDRKEIYQLRELSSEFIKKYKDEFQESLPNKWENKLMTHEEARQLLKFLHERCSARHPEYRGKVGKKRPSSAIVHAWQVYLITKFLVYCPVRVQEIEQLALGKTLFRQEDKQGKPYYVVQIKEHKNYSKTKKLRHYRLPDILTKDLDFWIDEILPQVKRATSDLYTWFDFKFDTSQDYDEYYLSLKNRYEKALEEGHQKRANDVKLKLRRVEILPETLCKIQMNLNNLETIFFKVGGRFPELYGTPHSGGSIYHMITKAVNQSSQAELGRKLRTNPHAFRHIAEAHIRCIGGNTKSFGTYIGHSDEMGDYYAKQILTDYNESEECAYGWWLADDEKSLK